MALSDAITQLTGSGATPAAPPPDPPSGPTGPGAEPGMRFVAGPKDHAVTAQVAGAGGNIPIPATLPGSGLRIKGVPIPTGLAGGGAPASTPGATGPSSGGPPPYPGLDYLKQIQAGYAKEATDLNAQAKAAIEKINAGSGDIDKMMTRVREAQDRADRAQDTALKAIKEIPKNPELDGVKHLGGLATLVGILGGALTHRPMTASLNAAGAALEAYNAGDLRNYKLSYDNWKTQTDLLFKIADMNTQRVKDILGNEKIGLDEKHAQLDTYLRAAGLSQLADEAQIKGPMAALDWSEKMAAASQQYELRKATLEQTKAWRESQLDKPVPITGEDGKPYLFYPQSQRMEPLPGHLVSKSGGGAGAQKAADTNAVIDADVADYVAAHPNASGADIARQRYESRVKHESELKGGATGRLTDAAADILAQRWIMGDPGAITSMPRSGPARIQVENRIAEVLKDTPDAARQTILNRMRMLEAESAARTAGRVTMQTTLYSKEAEGAGAEVVRTSELVPRSETPIFNRALESFYRQEGDPNIIRFGQALNALVNAYGKMSNPTGTGIHDADKDFLRQTIDTSLSKGQINAGVDQIIREGRIVATAAQQAQEEVLQHLAPTIPGQTPPAAAAPRPTGGGNPAPTITNQKDYDALPAGTPYTGPDGKTYRKGQQ